MIGKNSVMLNSNEKRVIDQIAERAQDLCESSPFLVPNTLRKRLHGALVTRGGSGAKARPAANLAYRLEQQLDYWHLFRLPKVSSANESLVGFHTLFAVQK